jgi:pyruvyl transferase EpsO
MARRRVVLGFDQIDSAERVVTDRLHGHILSRLLDKPQIVIDNDYGKIRRYIGVWGGGDTRLARDFAEAAEMAAG